ncbi:MAG: hypothetical protein ABL908_11670 [Hyphomicrobium sp.]
MPPLDAAPDQAQMQQTPLPHARANGRPHRGEGLARKLKTGVPGRGAHQRRADAQPSPSQLKAMRARELFLQALTEGKPVLLAARATGTAAATFYRWRDADLEFAETWDAAMEEGLDLVEDRIHAASEKDWRAGVRILEARRPKTWGRKCPCCAGRSENAALADVTVNVGTLDETRQRVAELERKLLGEAAPSRGVGSARE